MDDDVIRLECRTCCYAVTGWSPYAKAADHEIQTGHVMEEVYP